MAEEWKGVDAEADSFFEDWEFTDDAGAEHVEDLRTLLRRAHREGQRDMRERAAEVTEGYGCAHRIRALSIEAKQ
jgi:hypothetical protein